MVVVVAAAAVVFYRFYQQPWLSGMVKDRK